MAMNAAVDEVVDGPQLPGDGAPGAEPTMDDLWRLLGRADVIMRGLVEAPDREVRERWRAKIGPWLHDVGQAWVHAPLPPPPAPVAWTPRPSSRRA